MQCSTLVPSPSVHKADPSHCLTVWTRDYHSLVCASVFPSLFPLLCLSGGKRGSDGEREREAWMCLVFLWSAQGEYGGGGCLLGEARLVGRLFWGL